MRYFMLSMLLTCVAFSPDSNAQLESLDYGGFKIVVEDKAIVGRVVTTDKRQVGQNVEPATEVWNWFSTNRWPSQFKLITSGDPVAGDIAMQSVVFENKEFYLNSLQLMPSILPTADDRFYQVSRVNREGIATPLAYFLFKGVSSRNLTQLAWALPTQSESRIKIAMGEALLFQRIDPPLAGQFLVVPTR